MRNPDVVSSSSEVSTPDCSAGVPPAVSGASRPRFGEVTIRDRGRLPHWEKDSAAYFITFRLADSPPKSVLESIELEKKNILRTAAQMARSLWADEHQRLMHLSSKRIEDYLDRGAGACRLADSLVARTVSSALLHFDEKRYRLFTWCIMPNHVHVVVRLFPCVSLASVLHSWKSFTSKEVKVYRMYPVSSGNASITTISFVMKPSSIAQILTSLIIR